MSEPENTPQNSSEATGLKQEVAALHRQGSVLFIGLIVVSLTLTAYLFLQAKRSADDLTMVRNQAKQQLPQLQEVNKNIKMLKEKLVEYGKNHPDYAQKVLAKYASAAPQPAAATTPAAAPKK